ncbi:MAG: long-chain fatty acid--CoA ligase [SAR324 cluster bacterium]|nr:long-chain fatty acid--CoA ligase [SAR324 cluster bacterium]
MRIEELQQRLEQYSEIEAIIHKHQLFSYRDLLRLTESWFQRLAQNKIEPGTVVAVTSDYSADAIALMAALILNKNIAVPLTPLAKTQFNEYFKTSYTQSIIDLTQTTFRISDRKNDPLQNDLLRNLIEQQHPGLILFTSGSTGQAKAVVHDFEKLLTKFTHANKGYRSLVFLMFDHIAGIDSYFYSLYSGGTMIFPVSRLPKEICGLIEKHRVEVLPASPTFLNLLLLSGEHLRHDLDSLKIITFGSERAPQSLLKRLKNNFPQVRLVQKYGLTELGSPSSKSMEADASWLKIDSPRFKTKIINKRLHIKSDAAMLGYLNAPDPFTGDGWFDTGDTVEVKGEYLRILGRESEIINVGGEKVFPVEVEEVIQMMPGVEDVVVSGVPYPITGQIVKASVQLETKETLSEFRQRMRDFCEEKLPRFKIPQKVTLAKDSLHGDRFKKMRG